MTRLLKLLHIVIAAGWLGAVLVLLVLVAARDPRLDQAAFVVGDVVVWSSLLSLTSALLLSWLTSFGFLRLRWVRVKWIALIALAALGVFARTPALNTLAARADVDGVCADRGVALAVLVVEAVILLLIFALSVLRPWGRAHHDLEPGPKLRTALAVVVVATAACACAQSLYLRSLRHAVVTAVDVGALDDGVYQGAATAGVTVHVRAVVDGGRLVAVDVVDLPGGVYADLARGVTQKMVRSQRVDVDGVSGATTTSRALQQATSAALRAQASWRGGAPASP